MNQLSNITDSEIESLIEKYTDISTNISDRINIHKEVIDKLIDIPGIEKNVDELAELIIEAESNVSDINLYLIHLREEKNSR